MTKYCKENVDLHSNEHKNLFWTIFLLFHRGNYTIKYLQTTFIELLLYKTMDTRTFQSTSKTRTKSCYFTQKTMISEYKTSLEKKKSNFCIETLINEWL